MKPSKAVVEVVAKEEDVAPENLEPPLYEVVDPDALDSLFDDDRDPIGTVSFVYKGHQIVVDSTDSVSLVPQRSRMAPSDRNYRISIE